MMFIDIADLSPLRKSMQPLMCLDVGDKRIGCAISDRTWLVASGLTVIEHKKFTPTAAQIFKLLDENNCCALVIGLPLNMDGTSGPRAQSIQDFARNLLELQSDLKITFWDERLSTVAAETALLKADVTRKKRKKVIDKMAATYILQGALDRLSYIQD